MNLPIKLHGTVEQGKKIGRRLGFPTANIKCENKNSSILNGVYIASLTLPEGASFNGVANIGVHPTFPEGPPTVEIHLLDFYGEIYERRVTLTLLEYLRPEIRFQSSAALKKQVFEDIETAKKYFGIS